MSDNWQQGKNKNGDDKYYIKNDEWTICKVKIDTNTFYELWHKQVNYGHSFTNLADAKAQFEKVKID